MCQGEQMRVQGIMTVDKGARLSLKSELCAFQGTASCWAQFWWTKSLCILAWQISHIA